MGGHINNNWRSNSWISAYSLTVCRNAHLRKAYTIGPAPLYDGVHVQSLKDGDVLAVLSGIVRGVLMAASRIAEVIGENRCASDHYWSL